MKTSEYIGQPTDASAGLEVLDIKIGTSRAAQLMVMDVLSRSLYTDKITAVWREYGCNAADANVEAGKPDLPFKIVLPTNISPNAIIRDYGYGMTRQQVEETFINLGESTKRGSNEVTGMLGIGSKAGFSYGDSFLVTSFTKGTKTVYNCFRDQGVPKMAVMSTQHGVDEPDGIEINIPVRREDISSFVGRATNTFQYFRIRPEVKGGTIDWKNFEPTFKGNGWALLGGRESVAIMGNVGYKIDSYAMGFSEYGSKKGALISHGVMLYFDIGELDIAANREGLQYKGKTISAINSRLDTLMRELAVTITKTVASSPSFWHANVAYDKAFKLSSYSSGIANFVPSNSITWRGIKLEGDSIDICNDIDAGDKPDPEISVILYSKERWRKKPKSHPNAERIFTLEDSFLVLNNTPKKSPQPGRIRYWFKQRVAQAGGYHSGNLAVITYQTDAALDRFIKAKHLEGAPTLMMMDLPKPPPKISTGSVSKGPYNSKYSAQAFVMLEDAIGNSGDKMRSKWWKVERVDLQKGGVYVALDNFWVLAPYPSHPESLARLVFSLRKAGIITTPLYGFKADKLAKLDDTLWTGLKEFIKQQYDKILAEAGELQKCADYLAAAAYGPYFDIRNKGWLPSGSQAWKLLHEVEKALGVKYGKAYDILYTYKDDSRWISPPKLPKSTINFSDQEEKMLAAYPLLEKLTNKYSMSSISSQIDFAPIAEYIRLIGK